MAQYTMDGSFDIYTLIFFIIAVVVFIQLRSVLGKRTGSERPPYDPYTSKDKGNDKAKDTEQTEDNIVPLPRRGEAKPVDQVIQQNQQTSKESLEKHISKVAKAGTLLHASLIDMVKLDDSFDPVDFMGGAKSAYELIVTAFAGGDKKTLKQLLSSDVYEGFLTAIQERMSRDETIDFSFVGIEKAKLVTASLTGREARLEVEFKSEIISATMDKEGRVIEGDPNAIDQVTDIWTFERELTSNDPNWLLVATETPVTSE